MVFVTRCPYCGSVWLLPDRETAERGPVKCSDCQHSFDATSDMLQVPEKLFPNMPKPRIKPPAHLLHPHEQAKPHSETALFCEDAAEKSAQQNSARHQESKLAAEVLSTPAAAKESAPEIPEEAPKENIISAATEPAAAQPAPQAATKHENAEPAQPPHKHGVPLHGSAGVVSGGVLSGLKVPAGEVAHLPSLAGAKTEPHLSSLPASGLSKLEPHLSLDQAAQVENKTVEAPKSASDIIPSRSQTESKEVRIIAAQILSTDAEERKASRAAGIASVTTAVILLLILAAVLSVVFNQRIIKAFPQTQNIFTEICGKVPCPGFYLADASAFEITRSNLRAVDESGNYLLEITVVNKSKFAQAVPSLDIVLVDAADSPLMKRTLKPQDYLSDPVETESIAPGRSMSIRFSLQTNVTPASCVVTPVFPEQSN